jgi:hypothetical protein
MGDDEKREPPGARFSVSSIFQSPTLQRSVLLYNDAHRIVFGSLYSYVLYSGRVVLNILGIKAA